MKIVVDRLLCDANGLCVIEAPDLLVLDEDEELVVQREDVASEAATRAERAVAACPKAALSLIA
jgi:ferredoxin